jgi:hypothetical protein
MEHHWRLVRKDPAYRWRARLIEQEIKVWMALYGDAGLRTGLIRIPVVVHVVYNTAAQNISDAQIHSQIDVLNADYRRLNADAAQTPAAFAGVAADARIEFALAVRDPNCNLTTGITRTQTSVTGWVWADDGMKVSSATGAGGHDPWNVDKYLNIWVVNYSDGTLGYGTRPAMTARIQGVVCHYQAFGTIGALIPHAHLGRTATHEIGHWLDLIHIWGGSPGAASCTDSDNVADTPNQNVDSPFGACRVFPAVSCSNGPNGDMFMNYMDYSGDDCMNLFTAGQVARMDATLHTVRASILASDGLVPATGVAGPDLWMQDVSGDLGAEPDPSAQPMWISDDIWVRTTNDGLLNQDHQNPEYRPPGSASNYVYVRVRNRGCSGTGVGTLKLYWAKASTGLSWPSPWDGSVTAPALMGGILDSQSVSVAAGDDEIYVFPWMPPNPADYASFGAGQSHFCLLARIETSATAPFGMTFPETANLYANVKNNNNIVWKNITIVDEQPGGGRFASVIIANFAREAEPATLLFLAPRGQGPSMLDWGQVFLEFPSGLIGQRAGKDDGTAGVRRLDDTTFELLEPEARLGTFELARDAIHTLHIRLVPWQRHSLGARVFTLDLAQKVKERLVGGQRFVVKTAPDSRQIKIDDATNVFDGVSWVPIDNGRRKHPCGCSGK